MTKATQIMAEAAIQHAQQCDGERYIAPTTAEGWEAWSLEVFKFLGSEYLGFSQDFDDVDWDAVAAAAAA